MTGTPSPRLPVPWQRPLAALAITVLALVALFSRDAVHMASIWWNTSTFNHCLILLPIIGWLVAQRWPALKSLTPRIWWPGLVLVAGGAVSWMLGEAAGVALARHLGLVVMLQGAVVTILGLQVVRTLLFPIAYALFLVPFGEEFVPALQILTADLAMTMLGWVGIPAHIEGVFITTPHGWFEVAEACSGVKFLIAMVALGTLAAHLLFERWGKRIAFMALAVVVPVLANGIRAFATIWYAERYGVEYAAGFDHIIFGWVFFGIVLAIVMGIGWWWSDRDDFGAGAEADKVEPSGKDQRQRLSPWLAPVATVLVALLPVGWLGLTGSPKALAEKIAVSDPAGWTREAQGPAIAEWKPVYGDANRTSIADYTDASGRSVRLAITPFARQTIENAMVGYGRGVIGEDSQWTWVSSETYGNGRLDTIVTPEGVTRKVAVYYRFGDTVTGSKSRAKLLGLKTRLLGQDQRAVAIMISAVERPGIDAADAIADFIAATGSPASLADAAFETR